MLYAEAAVGIVIVAVATGWLGYEKGDSFWVWFGLACFLPIIALIIAAVMGSDHEELAKRALAQGKAKQCPYCMQLIHPQATVCPYCHSDLRWQNPQYNAGNFH
jgi:uncharacterized paraquat-inducible protein A